jgi:hypothetical protein
MPPSSPYTRHFLVAPVQPYSIAQVSYYKLDHSFKKMKLHRQYIMVSAYLCIIDNNAPIKDYMRLTYSNNIFVTFSVSFSQMLKQFR